VVSPKEDMAHEEKGGCIIIIIILEAVGGIFCAVPIRGDHYYYFHNNSSCSSFILKKPSRGVVENFSPSVFCIFTGSTFVLVLLLCFIQICNGFIN